MAISRVSGLMEYFPANSKFLGHLSLEQHAREPKILVTCVALVDPIAATAIDGPIAEGLLKPHRKKHLDVACPKTAVFVTSGQIDLRKIPQLAAANPCCPLG